MSAAAYSATLTTARLQRSGQILTCLAASVHETYDCSTDLSADESQNVKTEIKKSSSVKPSAFASEFGPKGF